MTGVDKAVELNIKQNKKNLENKQQYLSNKALYYLEFKPTGEVTWGKGLSVVEESSV